MKLQLLSDIHIEFAPFTIPETDVDVIILKGDIDVGLDGINWAVPQRIGKPIIHGPGNHEYYQHAPSIINMMKDNAVDMSPY